MVVHDSFDAPYMIIGVSGPIILVQGRWFFHSSGQTNSPDLLGQGTTKIFFVARLRGVRMSASLGFSASFARDFAVVFWRVLADFLRGFGGAPVFLLG